MLCTILAFLIWVPLVQAEPIEGLAEIEGPANVETDFTNYKVYYAVDQDVTINSWEEWNRDGPAGTRYDLAGTVTEIGYGRSEYLAAAIIRQPRTSQYRSHTDPYIALAIQEQRSCVFQPVRGFERYLVKSLLVPVENCNCWPGPRCSPIAMMIDHNDPDMYQWRPVTVDGHPGVEVVFYEYIGADRSWCDPVDDYNEIHTTLLKVAGGEEYPYESTWAKITFVSTPPETMDTFLSKFHIEVLI